jgi:hypothetical protein
MNTANHISRRGMLKLAAAWQQSRVQSGRCSMGALTFGVARSGAEIFQ